MKKYDYQNETPGKLLAQAANAGGATLLIPDIQRPYVWGPKQVILLVDSILKGWPFGTILLWKITEEQYKSIPKRTLLSLVDRTIPEQAAMQQAHLPNDFRLVLDGQQRLQSLLIAFSGDAYGFKLNDAEWKRNLDETAGKSKSKHWSVGHLCIDLHKFKEFTSQPQKIDHSSYLTWVSFNKANGRSPTQQPNGYEFPIQAAWLTEGRYLRLSRLWDIPSSENNILALRARLIAILRDLKFPDDQSAITADHLTSIASQILTFRDEQLSLVQIRERDSSEPEEDYGDAIVNIFTRLNGAGTPLTKEEITFSWISQGWGYDADMSTAKTKFEELEAESKKLNYIFKEGDLVQLITTAWSGRWNGGVILTNNDLIQSKVVKRMAGDVKTQWAVMRESVLTGLKFLADRSLTSSLHFKSNNVLSVLLTWRYMALDWESAWKAQAKRPALEQEAFRNGVDSIFNASCDQWLILSQWSGRWNATTNIMLANYVKELGQLSIRLQGVEPSAAITEIEAVMTGWLEKLKAECIPYINQLDATRATVREYHLPLWLWQRLDRRRHEFSDWAVKTKNGDARIEVDHIISFKLWQNIPVEERGHADAVFDNPDEVEVAAINEIGNCTLLKKSFNISKNDKELGDFLSQVPDFKQETHGGAPRLGDASFDDWCSALAISRAMVRPKSHPSEINAQIRTRTKHIKDELIAYIQGTSHRTDC
jgi:hypothetical protein